jgi:hypothetical protein
LASIFHPPSVDADPIIAPPARADRRLGADDRVRPLDDWRCAVLEVEVRNIAGEATAVGSAGPYTLVVDRPGDDGGRGLGFNGGQLLYLAVAGCVSNDLFREARGDRPRPGADPCPRRLIGGDPAVSGDVEYDVELDGDAPADRLEALVRRVDEIAEIPNSLRRGTPVRLGAVRVRPLEGGV